MKWFAQTPAGRDFPERIEVVDIALPGAPLCELEIVPGIEEGKIAAPTATYVLERKRLSRRERSIVAALVAAVVAARFSGVIG